VKEWLKSVLNYRSYPKIKPGIRFLDHPVDVMEIEKHKGNAGSLQMYFSK